MIILAVDPGKARTGLAVCDKTMFLASPLSVIEEWNKNKLAERISLEAKKQNAELIVVGLPKNMDGTEGESARSARLLAEQISEISGIKTVLHDERCTTVIAHQYLNDNNIRGKKRKKTVDAAAATIILQSYLDTIKNTKNSF